MNVEADALRYDDLKQTSVFTGNVVVTKGTILIRGARIEVRQDPEGYQYGVVTAEPGKLGLLPPEARGRRTSTSKAKPSGIEYDGKADRVQFISHAELRRCAAPRSADEIAGSLITYDNTTDVFTRRRRRPPSPATRAAACAPCWRRATAASAPAAGAPRRRRRSCGRARALRRSAMR